MLSRFATSSVPSSYRLIIALILKIAIFMFKILVNRSREYLMRTLTPITLHRLPSSQHERLRLTPAHLPQRPRHRRGRSQTRATTSAERACGWGPQTFDVYLNEAIFWKNIPPSVWDFHIGGYQVIKKWLSYREHRLLGRALHLEEIREVTHTARRLAALVLLQTDLDANTSPLRATPGRHRQRPDAAALAPKETPPRREASGRRCDLRGG